MKVIPTPEMLEAAYDLLRCTTPFKGWKLPPASEIEFHVIAGKDRQADYSCDNGTHKIRLSQRDHRSLDAILLTMAHEMCHLREYMQGFRRADIEHGASFKKLARRVCKAHGFDPGQFKGVL